MYALNDKRRLYQLMDAYLRGLITGWTFCNEFYVAYDVNEFDIHLDDIEKKAFGELSEVAGRYSPFKEDYEDHPKAFYTKEELKAKVLETQEKLNALGYGRGITFVMEDQSDE